jgi:hypothetical protein
MTSHPLPEVNSSPVDYLTSTIRFEENLIYIPKAGTTTPWQWTKIVAPNSEIFDIDLPGAVSGPGNLRIALWGVTIASGSPAHHIQVNINNQLIGEVAWDGQSIHIFETYIPAGVLQKGMNKITVFATGEVEARIDIINLDWFEIKYQKTMMPWTIRRFLSPPNRLSVCRVTKNLEHSLT